MSRIYKDLLQINKKNIKLKWSGISQKKKPKRLLHIWKDAQLHF